MRIHAVSQSYNAELRKIDSAKKVEKDSKTAKTNVDRSDFSSSARHLNEANTHIESIQAALSVQPEIRADRIADVQQKIDNGYYNSDEFLNKLTEKLMREFGLDR